MWLVAPISSSIGLEFGTLLSFSVMVFSEPRVNSSRLLSIYYVPGIVPDTFINIISMLKMVNLSFSAFPKAMYLVTEVKVQKCWMNI